MMATNRFTVFAIVVWGLTLIGFFLFTRREQPIPNHVCSRPAAPPPHSHNHSVSTHPVTTPQTVPEPPKIVEPPKVTEPARRKNRIAVLINGAIRSLPDVFPINRNNFFLANEYPDLYINAVYSTEEERLGFEGMKHLYKGVVKMNVKKANLEELTAEVKHMYPSFPFPRDMCTEFLTYPGCHNWISSLQLIRQSYDWAKEVNDKKKAELNLQSDYYDIVFRVRTDVMFEQNVNLLDMTIEPNTFYTSKLYNWADGFNDQIGFGSMKVMDTYSHLFYDIDIVKGKRGGRNYHPETFLETHIHSNGHSHKYLPISYRIVRKMALKYPNEFRDSCPPFHPIGNSIESGPPIK